MTSEEEDIADIDEDIGEDEDFENGSPGSSTAVTPSHPHGPYRSMGSAIPERMGFSRQGSMATVRLKRRAKLAEKLKEVFGLREIEDVVAGMVTTLTSASAWHLTMKFQKCLVGCCDRFVSRSVLNAPQY